MKTNNQKEIKNLVLSYNETQDELTFIDLWENVKTFSFSISKQYYNFTDEEKVSLAQECLWKACRTYKEQTNFLTYYGNVLRNKLIDEVQALNCGTRLLNSNAKSLEVMYEATKFEPSSNYNDFSISNFIEECKLTQTEATMCVLLFEGYKRYEIMEKLKIKSGKQFMNLKKKLQAKVKENYLINELF